MNVPIYEVILADGEAVSQGFKEKYAFTVCLPAIPRIGEIVSCPCPSGDTWTLRISGVVFQSDDGWKGPWSIIATGTPVDLDDFAIPESRSHN